MTENKGNITGPLQHEWIQKTCNETLTAHVTLSPLTFITAFLISVLGSYIWS